MTLSNSTVTLFIIISMGCSLLLAQNDSLKFGLIADPHYAEKEGTSSRCYREAIGKVDYSIQELNQHNLTFLTMLGDYVDGYTGGDGKTTIEDMKRLNGVMQDFNGDLYYVMGNHDFEDLDMDEWLENSAGKIQQNYYSYSVSGFHFIVLDGNFTSEGIHYGRTTGERWGGENTFINEAQMTWLETVLDTSGDMPTIVFTHENLHKKVDASGSYPSVVNSVEVRAILEEHGNVTHVFQGHHHSGHYEEINGIHYTTIRGMISCPEDLHRFAYVTIRSDSLYVTGLGDQPSYVQEHAGLLKVVWPDTVDTTTVDTTVDTTVNVIHNSFRVTKDLAFIEQTGSFEFHIYGLDGKALFSYRGRGRKLFSLNSLLPRNYTGVVMLELNSGSGPQLKKWVLTR